MNILICYISAFTGALTIMASLFLLYKKRISLENITSNPNMKEEAIKAEIFNYLKISSNVPAIALFLIGLLLIVIPLFAFPQSEKVYTVRGTVKKTDSATSKDIQIVTRYPPLYASPDGEIVGLDVWRGPDGKLPNLFFDHPDYEGMPIDLNDPEKTKIKDKEIKIIQTIELRRVYKE
jgi:hypothetical protein